MQVDNNDSNLAVSGYAYNRFQIGLTEKKPLKKKKKETPSWVGGTILHQACSQANIPPISLIKYLVEEAKLDVNKKNFSKENSLLILLKNHKFTSNTEIGKILLENGVEINAQDKDSNFALTIAVEDSDLFMVELLLEHNPQLNIRGATGLPPLLIATKQRNLNLCELLLKTEKCNVNFLDSKNRNCLHWAINNATNDADASNEIENLILSAGVDINQKDIRGRLPLHYAFVKIGDPLNTRIIDPIETVSNVLSRPGMQLNTQDNWGKTVLHYAAQRGSIISSLYLLERGAEIDPKDRHGNTPLAISMLFGHLNMSIYLIQRKANLSLIVKVFTLEMLREEMREIRKAEEEKKKFLENEKKKLTKGIFENEEEENLEVEFSSESEPEPDHPSDDEYETKISTPVYSLPFGARKSRVSTRSTPSPSIFGDLKECTMFRLAITQDWQSVAFLMLEFGFELSLAVLDCFAAQKFNYVYTLLLKKSEAGVYQMKNRHQQNLAHLFAQNSVLITQAQLYDKIYNKLRVKKIPFEETDNFGRNCLHYAMEAGSEDLIKDLLGLGLDPNMLDKEGMSPLGLLVSKNSSKIFSIENLLKTYKFDFDLNFKIGEEKFSAATYVAAHRKDVSILQVLKNCGADISKRDTEGKTPLIIFIRENNFGAVQKLVNDLEVDPSVCDARGKSVLHHIVNPRDYGSYENLEMLNFLCPFVDINKKDNDGFSAAYYASRQGSGRLLAALEELGVAENEMIEEDNPLQRVVTSLISGMEFSSSKYNFEEDAQKFIKEQEKIKKDKGILKTEDKIPVDSAVQNPERFEVVYEGDDAFDAYMVKVEIGRGYYSGNTFYKMQLLREKIRDVNVMLTRWGRVGTEGQFQQTPLGTLEEAKTEFGKVFKSKTGNNWEEKQNFEKKPKKYRLVPYTKKVHYSEFLQPINYKDPALPDSTLSKPIFRLIRRISNFKMISKTLNLFGIDEKQLPSQNLSKERLEEALQVLSQLKDAAKRFDTYRNKTMISNLEEVITNQIVPLTNEFYELIPTQLYQTTSIPPLCNANDISQKQKIVLDLFCFEVVFKLLLGAFYRSKELHPVDYVFNCMDFKIVRLERDEGEYQIVREYIRTGRQGQSVKKFISNIYAIGRKDERENIQNWDHVGKRTLLWHGTRAENIIGILQNGFRIAPSDALGTGAMFGSGIYFADIFNKSYNYSYNFMPYNFRNNLMNRSKRYMFLCEVALGNQMVLTNAKQVKKMPNNQYQSVWGYGKIEPHPEKNIYLANGTRVPIGEIVAAKPREMKKNQYWALQHHEYVVYDTTQVRIKYLVELNNKGGDF